VRRLVCLEIDSHGFDWQIFLVSASGFLTDSYALFATNVVLPSLAYIYWPDTANGKPELIINCVTLGGCMVGQILFGFLADKFGRRRLYGLELVIVIFSTLGMTQASTGANNSMNILGWIYFWRFFTGLGIGAEYPLTAIITAE
jgi:PHS family inorganic phosphate transporter-like MFS transporter